MVSQGPPRTQESPCGLPRASLPPQGIPKGPRRFENQEWAALIMSQVFPYHSDVDWEEYVDWVKDGGGDEWFQENALFCNKHQKGPLDVWYDCDACVQEVRAGQMPQDGRYIWVPLNL